MEIDEIGSINVTLLNKKMFTSWVLLTTALFLSFNYLVFAILAALIVIFSSRNLPSGIQASFYVVLLLSLPALNKTLPGAFGLNKLFEISWPLVLGLIFFLKDRFGRMFVIKNKLDWMVIFLFVWTAVLSFRGTTITDGLRGAFMYFNMIYIPYFIARKTVTNTAAMKYVFWGVAFIIFMLSCISVFISMRHWQLYDSLNQPLALNSVGISNYKYREGFLRTGVTIGAIQFAAIGSCAVIMYIYLIKKLELTLFRKLVFVLFALGIMFTFSRGPWIVGAMMVALYLLMAYRSRGLVLFFGGVFAFGALLLAAGVLDSVMYGFSLKDSSNVDYREQLLHLGIEEMMKFPLFGNQNFMQSPDLQVLRQGEGIIDIVNTFLQIGLQFGVIPVLLFAWMVFGWPLTVYKRIKKNGNTEILDVARVYFVVMLSLGLSIITVSSFGPGSALFLLIMFLIGAGHGIKKI